MDSRLCPGEAAPPRVINGHGGVVAMFRRCGSWSVLWGGSGRRCSGLRSKKSIKGLTTFFDTLAAAVTVVRKSSNRCAKLFAVYHNVKWEGELSTR
jgi:hypothetical protein